jgi:hypothetical protein
MTCDAVVCLCSQTGYFHFKRIPFFDPFASMVERDAAIENAKKILGQH